MHDFRWTLLGLVGSVGLWLAAFSASNPAMPALVGQNMGPEVAELEAYVSAHPEDANALSRLSHAYLDHAAPGLAQAALDRAPLEVRDVPSVGDARARALWELGRAQIALDVQRNVLDACRVADCSYALVGKGRHRERMLAEMVKLGVDDPKSDPSLAFVAYQRSTRQVSLDLR